MVINGKEFSSANFKVVNFEGDRIRLPAQFVEHLRLSGDDPIKCLLLVVTPGRYRLIMDLKGPTVGTVSGILKRIEEAEAAGDMLELTENNAQAGIRARLIPTVLSPRGPGWRINFPKEARDLVSDQEDRSFVFVLIVAGFIEFWFPDTLRTAVSVPISQLLS